MHEHVSLHTPRTERLTPLIVLSNDRVIPTVQSYVQKACTRGGGRRPGFEAIILHTPRRNRHAKPVSVSPPVLAENG